MKKNFFSLMAAAALLVSCFPVYEFPTKTYTPAATTDACGEGVDLGLSVLWADRNVGAESSDATGGYYAWGETVEKTTYEWTDYIWCKDGDHVNPTKYNTESTLSLEEADDVAAKIWGDGWRMPTVEEINELKENCTWKWSTDYTLPGFEVTGPNGNKIFLPAAGARGNGNLGTVESYGYYWSSGSTRPEMDSADCLSFRKAVFMTDVWYGRNVGRSVRPVHAK